MAAQLAPALDDLEAVLGGAGRGPGGLVRLVVHTTDVDRLLERYGVPAALPDLLVELEATAAA